jgi:integrase
MQVEEKSAGDVTAPASAGQSGLNGSATRPVAVRDGAITLAALIDAYMSQYCGRDTTRPQRLGWWHAQIGHLTLAQLDDDHVFALMEDLAQRRGTYYIGKDASGAAIMKAKKKPLAVATLNRYQASLSAVLTWAQRRRITPKGWANPCRMIPMRREHNQVVRFLSDAERERLLAACRESKWAKLYLLVLTALTTGARLVSCRR